MRSSGTRLSALCAILISWTAQAASEKSVYEIHPVADAAIVGVASVGSLLPYAFASSIIHPRCPCDPAEVNALDRGVIGNQNVFLDNLSDATAGAAVLLPLVSDWADLGWKRELAEDAVVYAEVLSVNGAWVSLAKYTVQRPLPRTYAGDSQLISSPGGYRSFYSGHVSLVFSALSASAVTLNLRHHAGVWPWLVVAGVGLSVAAERVAAGRHFYTDVTLGALTGTLIGTFIPLWHAKSPETLSTWHVGPAPGRLAGAQVSWTRRF